MVRVAQLGKYTTAAACGSTPAPFEGRNETAVGIDRVHAGTRSPLRRRTVRETLSSRSAPSARAGEIGHPQTLASRGEHRPVVIGDQLADATGERPLPLTAQLLR